MWGGVRWRPLSARPSRLYARPVDARFIGGPRDDQVDHDWPYPPPPYHPPRAPTTSCSRSSTASRRPSPSTSATAPRLARRVRLTWPGSARGRRSRAGNGGGASRPRPVRARARGEPAWARGTGRLRPGATVDPMSTITGSRRCFSHEALFYSGMEGFLEGDHPLRRRGRASGRGRAGGGLGRQDRPASLGAQRRRPRPVPRHLGGRPQPWPDHPGLEGVRRLPR